MLQLLEVLTNPSDAAIKTYVTTLRSTYQPQRCCHKDPAYMLQLIEALTNPSDAAKKTQHICYNS